MKAIILCLLFALSLCIIDSQIVSDLSSSQLISLSLNQSYLFPLQMISHPNTCAPSDMNIIKEGTSLRAKASKPFTLFLTTQLSSFFYTGNFDNDYGTPISKLVVNKIVVSNINEQKEWAIDLELPLACQYVLQPSFRLNVVLRFDFDDGKSERYLMPWLLQCASQEQVDHFGSFYNPGYVIFWLVACLTLQIYSNFERDRYHVYMLVVFIALSFAINYPLIGYFVQGAIFLLVLLRQRREGHLGQKSFVLYIFLVCLVILQIVYTLMDLRSSTTWGGIWIAMDNFITLMLTMFILLRLIKFQRLRHAFWYFCLIALVAIATDDLKNHFFSLEFRTPLDLSCVTYKLFFPLMMLPMGNFMSGITDWMHRPVAFAAVITSLLPLSIGIQFMGVSLMALLMVEVARKGVSVISRTV